MKKKLFGLGLGFMLLFVTACQTGYAGTNYQQQASSDIPTNDTAYIANAELVEVTEQIAFAKWPQFTEADKILRINICTEYNLSNQNMKFNHSENSKSFSLKTDLDYINGLTFAFTRNVSGKSSNEYLFEKGKDLDFATANSIVGIYDEFLTSLDINTKYLQFDVYSLTEEKLSMTFESEIAKSIEFSRNSLDELEAIPYNDRTLSQDHTLESLRTLISMYENMYDNWKSTIKDTYCITAKQMFQDIPISTYNYEYKVGELEACYTKDGLLSANLDNAVNIRNIRECDIISINSAKDLFVKYFPDKKMDEIELSYYLAMDASGMNLELRPCYEVKYGTEIISVDGETRLTYEVISIDAVSSEYYSLGSYSYSHFS